jgi:hypothetical protein
MRTQTPLFETPPVTGELWYDVQFKAYPDPVLRPDWYEWMYFAGVPAFKTLRLAENWVTSLQRRASMLSYTLPELRFQPHFEEWPTNAWVGHPIPKDGIPKP